MPEKSRKLSSTRLGAGSGCSRSTRPGGVGRTQVWRGDSWRRGMGPLQKTVTMRRRTASPTGDCAIPSVGPNDRAPWAILEHPAAAIRPAVARPTFTATTLGSAPQRRGGSTGTPCCATCFDVIDRACPQDDRRHDAGGRITFQPVLPMSWYCPQTADEMECAPITPWCTSMLRQAPQMFVLGMVASTTMPKTIRGVKFEPAFCGIGNDDNWPAGSDRAASFARWLLC